MMEQEASISLQKCFGRTSGIRIYFSGRMIVLESEVCHVKLVVPYEVHHAFRIRLPLRFSAVK